MSRKLRVGVVGATGMVGQRFVALLAEHPWFELVTLAASQRSAGKSYRQAVEGRWVMSSDLPAAVADLEVMDAAHAEQVAAEVDFIFCAVEMPRDQVMALEERYARLETPVVSNNSAHRWTKDVPAIIPEVNAHHLEIISAQQKRLGTKRGFIVVKPNCSIQSYVPALHPLQEFGPSEVLACTYQAISGAGKTFESWPEMVDNVIPYIAGEEEKSEQEPLKIWGTVTEQEIVPACAPQISTQCIRVPASDGHLAAVFVNFQRKPQREEILERWAAYDGAPQRYRLPSAPQPLLRYFDEPDRPQTRLDRDYQGGMGITLGRLREDSLFDYKFICLSHNTLRGAAGGAVLTAELLVATGYLLPK